MKHLRSALAAALFVMACVAISPQAQAGKGWGVAGEEVVEWQVTVVDLACELTGDCPPECGAGARQLGLITADGTLWPVAKGRVSFANAIDDLLPFCGQQVWVDGLAISNPNMHLFMVQNYRAAPEDEWQRANGFSAAWRARTGLAPKGWYKKDPLIVETIAIDGVTGTGPDEDLGEQEGRSAE